MKPCPECGQIGVLLGHEAIQAGETTVQILDYELECPTHGLYDGTWKPTDLPDRERVQSPFAPSPEPLLEPEPEHWPELPEN